MPATSRLAAVAVIASLAITGCSSDGDEESPSAKNPAKSNAKDAPQATASVPSGDNGDLEDPEGAISALSGFSCSADDDGVWSASGTVENTGGGASKFLVTVAVIKKSDSSVQGLARETVDLDEGDKQEFHMDKVHKGQSTKGLQCVPRVVAGS